MHSNAARAALVAVLAVIAVVLFFALGEDDADEAGVASETTGAEQGAEGPPAKPGQPVFEVITMREGAPVGGVRELSYRRGDRVRIEVRLDEAQEDVHIHGYEIEKTDPRRTVRFEFPARLEGIFELEAHGPSGDVPLAELVVRPG